jgi:hypothetical protein
MTSLVLILLVAATPAQQHYAAGEAAFKLGNFEEAAKQYTAAYEAEKHADLLFNIAQCHRNLGQYDKAIFFLERYLEEAQPVKNRERIEELIYDLEQQRVVADMKVDETPPIESTIEAPARPPPAAPPPAAPPPPPPPAVTATAPVEAEPAVYEQGWFWGVMAGAAAVVGGAVAIAVIATRDGVPDGDYEFDLR